MPQQKSRELLLKQEEMTVGKGSNKSSVGLKDLVIGLLKKLKKSIDLTEEEYLDDQPDDSVCWQGRTVEVLQG